MIEAQIAILLPLGSLLAGEDRPDGPAVPGLEAALAALVGDLGSDRLSALVRWEGVLRERIVAAGFEFGLRWTGMGMGWGDFDIQYEVSPRYLGEALARIVDLLAVDPIVPAGTSVDGCIRDDHETFRELHCTIAERRAA